MSLKFEFGVGGHRVSTVLSSRWLSVVDGSMTVGEHGRICTVVAKGINAVQGRSVGRSRMTRQMLIVLGRTDS